MSGALSKGDLASGWSTHLLSRLLPDELQLPRTSFGRRCRWPARREALSVVAVRQCAVLSRSVVAPKKSLIGIEGTFRPCRAL